MTSIIEDLFKKLGLTKRQSKWIAYCADSIYWVILIYLIFNASRIANDMCLQSIYEINTNCNVFCNYNLQQNTFLNSSGFDISWTNNTNNGGGFWDGN